MRTGIPLALVACVLLLVAARALPGVGTVLPVSAASGTGIAGNLFPVGLQLDQSNLLLTEPTLIYIDARRLGQRWDALNQRELELSGAPHDLLRRDAIDPLGE